MAACKCNVGLSNTGTACTPVMSVTDKIILVPYYNNDGEVNSIDLTDTLDAAYFTALVNQADASKRWFPLPSLKNVADERAENVVESFDDGSSVFITDGNRSFTGLLIKGSVQLLKKINAARCVEVGIFVIDRQGNLIGSILADGTLAPIKLDKDSISALLVKTTDTTVQKIQLKFNFSQDESDENLRMVTADEMSYDVRLLKGLLDITVTYSSITTTGFVATLKTEYGTVITPVLDKGLDLADFALYNDTDSAAVTPSSVTEDPEGVYTFVMPAQGTTEVLFLTPTKAGRDYSAVVVSPITIP